MHLFKNAGTGIIEKSFRIENEKKYKESISNVISRNIWQNIARIYAETINQATLRRINAFILKCRHRDY